MPASMTVPNEVQNARTTVPPIVHWLLPGLTLLLAALAVYQILFLAPRCLGVMQRAGIPWPGALELMLSIPDWAAGAAALALSVFAFWQRGFVGRSALLTTTALAINVGLLLSLFGCLSLVLHAVPPP